MTNEELIAALEAADGPSRELDAEIARLVGTMPLLFGDEQMHECPAYTSSIDAALMLVPENSLCGFKELWAKGPDSVDGPKVWRASIDVYTQRDGLHWIRNELALAAHPANAIVIAAIKAGGKG